MNLLNKSRVSQLLLTLTLWVSALPAKDIFISECGKDTNSGAFDSPYATLQQAFDRVEAGDCIYLFPGYYHQKAVLRNIRGTEQKPTSIKALGHVVIDPPDDIELGKTDLKIGDFKEPLDSPKHLYYPFWKGAAIRIESCAFVTIEGLEVADSEWMGISSLYCDHLTIRKCILHDLGSSGFYMLYATNLVLENNEIIRACSAPRRVGNNDGHGSQECISVVNCDGFEVMYNRIHESANWNYVQYQASAVGGEGIDVKEHSKNGTVHHNYVYNIQRPSLYVDAWNSDETRNIDLYNNVSHNTQGMALGCEAGGLLENIRIYNNLSYNQWLRGLEFADWGHSGTKRNIYVVNNTFFNNWEGALVLGSERHHDIVVQNNIFYQNDHYARKEVDMGTAQKVTMQDNWGQDPQFLEPGNRQYELASGSPLIDKGGELPFEIPTDLNDAPRIAGDLVDIGAFEYGSQPISPRIIFVSKEKGKDEYSGTFYQPYKTIGKALLEVHPGDHIIVLKGIYAETLALENFRADSNHPLMIEGIGEVMITGAGADAPTLSLNRCENMLVSGIEFKNTQEPAFLIQNSSRIQIVNNTIASNVAPIQVNQASAVCIEFNQFSHKQNPEVIDSQNVELMNNW